MISRSLRVEIDDQIEGLKRSRKRFADQIKAAAK